MTVTVGSSLIAGSGASAVDVNALVESVNSLMEEVRELTEAVKSGTSGGSGNLSENVTLTIIVSDVGADEITTTSTASVYTAHSKAFLRVNGVDYYSQLVGKDYNLGGTLVDSYIQLQIPRGSSVVAEVRFFIKVSGAAYNYLHECGIQTCVADTHCTLRFSTRDTKSV